MADALFDDALGFEDFASTLHRLAIFIFSLVADDKLVLILSQRVSVHRSLGHQTVWKRNADNASNEASGSEEGKVPMEASRFFQWVLPCLCSDTADVLYTS